MYVPAHFEPDDEAVHRLLSEHGAVELITATTDGLMATTLPMSYDREAGVLRGHLARQNDQWRAEVLGDALVIARGPDSYISPSWYASKAEHGKVVPTWNYLTVHVHGPLTVHDDSGWLAAQVAALTDHHEAGRAHPWSVADAPERFVAGQLRAIVGVEVRVDRLEAKFKLSQNRPSADIDGVVAGLTSVGDHVGAALVSAHRGVK
ncbi:PaiB family negative transcriptional regulator [Actinomycetospora succinea]|uniref:PaiB family negative transcriptional regulator n=1 Tax=Actinomycetospora succinea TaxID=663603 RepID=A0A4R6VAU2_9PSEU|nr:FMN-binding negative transcriptional regulator [Actinomycetospora succinea]TDQ58795.1 PaiB family negative transcriptional regulator [Actinomycetospora succinea]